ncbi:MAG: AsmA-like C-terminal region-containing protein [Pseudomonadota bacterium]
MRPRQSVWKWLLAVIVMAIAVGLSLLLLRPAGPPSDLRGKVEASLSAWTGGTVKLQEPLRVRYVPPSIEGRLVLSDATKLPSVQSMSAPKFRLTLSLPDLLMGTISFHALRLDRPTLKLKAGQEARTAKTVLGSLTGFLAGAPLESVRVSRGTVRPATGNAAILRDIDLRLNTRARLGVLEAMGSFLYNGENVKFSLDRGRTAEAEGGRSAPLTLKITSTPITARFSGKMNLREARDDGSDTGVEGDTRGQVDTRGEVDVGGEGDLEAKVPDMRRFLAWIGVQLPAGESLRDVTAVGRVQWMGPTLTFEDGTFSFDGNEAVGVLALTAGERPHIDGTLAFETLSLDPYLPDSSEELSQEPLFDWVLFKHLNTDLRISAAELSAGDLQLGSGGVTIHAKNGHISSEIGSLEICEGLAAGRVDLDLSAPRVEATLSGSLTNVGIEACRESLGIGIPLAGSGMVRVDMSTGGTTQDEFIRGVAGTVEVAAEDGSLPIDLTTLMSEPDAETIGWSTETSTTFSELSADCRLSAGQLWCKSFRMAAAKKLVSGAGGLDISRQTLDWDLRMAESEAHQESDETTPASGPGITINGSIMAPEMMRAPASGTPQQRTAKPERSTEGP